MKRRDDLVYLLDLQHEISVIEQFVDGKLISDVRSDIQLQYALCRAFTILGEAANSLSQALKDANSHVPWQKIIGMRHRLVHDYSSVDVDILWDAVSLDIPALKADLADLLAPHS